MYKDIKREHIEVEWKEAFENLTDHKLGFVKIKTEIPLVIKKKVGTILSKKHAEWASEEMLDKILNSECVEDTIKAFEER